MDSNKLAHLNVSLHAAEDLRRSLNSQTGGPPRNVDWLHTSQNSAFDKYGPSSYETRVLGGNLDSSRTWPGIGNSSSLKANRSFDNHSLFDNSNRFANGEEGKSHECSLLSHSSGAEICPFDGSKYVLRPLTFKRSSEYEHSLQFGFKTIDFSASLDSNLTDEFETEEMDSAVLESINPWQQNSSINDFYDSFAGKMSSCRIGNDLATRNRYKSSPYARIGYNEKDSQSLSESTGSECPESASSHYSIKSSISAFRKELAAKYNNYRQEYLANSPVEELQTLNVAIVNVRKWLRRRNDTIKAQINSDSNKLQHGSSAVQRLISEAKIQQEGVDILLDRGQRFLAQRANIVLEVDLENLVFLWNSYIEDLRKFSQTAAVTHEKSSSDLVPAGICIRKDDTSTVDSHSSESFSSFASEKSEFQEYDDIVNCCTSERSVSPPQLIVKSFQSSSEFGSDNSHELTLADLETRTFSSPSFDKDSFFGNPNAATKPSQTLAQNEVAKEENSCIPQIVCDDLVTETQKYFSGLGKMDLEMAEKVSIQFDHQAPNLAVSEIADMEISKEFSYQKAHSLGGSSEMDNFDKAYPVNDSIGLGSPVEPKRRRRLLDAPSSVSSISSRSGSPISLKDSGCTTPTGTLTHGERQDDLWRAIGNIDNFLMDKDLLEACKSTENDLSNTDEDCVGAPSVSFAEFLQQYKELIDWLNQMHKVIQREVTSLAEKYMNQAYHEEMLERSPRREFLNKYSVQVLLRYPNMSEQISARMNRLNAQWTAVEEAIAPKHGKHDEDSMLQDLECDLNNLRRWLNAIESRLLPLTIHAEWSDSELEERLVHHQALQRDIESHNKVINAVLKLSERLEKDSACGSDGDRDSLQLVALNLERRWHGIWLQSLEWQCRLEEAIGRRKGIYNSGLDFSNFSLPVLDESLFNHCTQDINDQGLITLDDDSLLFIGGGRGYGLDSESQDFDSDYSYDALHGSASDVKEFDPEANGSSQSESVRLKKEQRQPLRTRSGSSLSKPDSPLGKRRLTNSCCEGSPAKKGLASSGELSPLCSGSPFGSVDISSEDCLSWQSVSHLPDTQYSPVVSVDDLKLLKVRRSLFDRSSGDSANISETESKMGDSPPVPYPENDPAVSNGGEAAGEADVHPRAVKTDTKDIGYSSESQSNDEVETMRQQIAMEYKFAGKVEVASDGPLGEKVLFPSVKSRSSYYQMTHVTDIDSTDKTDNGDTTDSGPEKVKESEAGSFDYHYENEVFYITGKDLSSLSESSSVPDENLSYNSNNNNNQQADYVTYFNGTGSLSTKIDTSNSCCQTDNPLGHLMPIHQLVDFSESDSAPESKGKKSVRYLIEHAEELVRPSTSPKRSRPLSPQKVSSSTQSLLVPSPSKQTQTDSCGTVESSCDASGEDNSDHEGSRLRKGEASTGTDDAEDRTLCESVICLGSGTESANNLSQEESKVHSLPAAPVMDTPRLRKQTGVSSRRRSKKDRPWSVVGFQDTSSSKKSDSGTSPVAASESAINHLHCHTDSDTGPVFPTNCSSTFPRSARCGAPPHSSSLFAHTSYHNIVAAMQDSAATTTTASIHRSISSSYPHSSLVPSDLSSGTDQHGRRGKTRRTKRASKQSSKEQRVPTPVQYYTTDSYDSADAESESETSDEYLTAGMEMLSSEADDAHNASGSLSELSTWDNYQMFYPTGSEDPGEELLSWEPQDDLEFEDDFQLPPDRSLVKDVMSNKAKTKLKIKKHGVSGEDSDSDLEDFHDILNQSELQLKLANQSLKKKRNDPMGTSLHPNPDKYAEILVTYETNIRCLEAICQHIHTENVTEADVKRVKDLMEQWCKVNALASERHGQTSALGELRDTMSSMKTGLQEAAGCLSYSRFSSADELKDTILLLKEKQASLGRQICALNSLKSQLSEFSSQHPFICVDKYKEDISRLTNDTSDMVTKVAEHTDGLENNWSVWLEYLESQRELDSWLAADRDRLHLLLSQREFGAKVTKRDVLKELETLQSNLSTYESKLSVLQAMYSRLTRTLNDDAQRQLLASLGDLRNQLFVVSERCKQVYRDIEDDEELSVEQYPDLGKLSMQAAAVHEMMTARSETPSEKMLCEDFQDSLSESTVSGTDPQDLPGSRVCVSWLRSVPVQVVSLMLVAGLVYALDPEILDRLSNFSLTVTPELRYINGPPAI